MIHKLLILTSDQTTLNWASLEDKKQHILNALNRTKNGVWQVEIKYRPLVPKIRQSGHIAHDWFDTISHPHFREGYHHVCLHFSMDQWETYGIKPTINGANHIDTDFVGDMYIRADETTVHKYGRGRRPRDLYAQFVQTLLHEMSHELLRNTGQKDITHDYHDTHSDISGIFEQIDMNDWQPVYQEGMVKVGLLQKVLDLTKKLMSLK